MADLHLRVLACPERYEDMAASERGRRCERCEREVIDTSGLDRSQLDALVREVPEAPEAPNWGACARFETRGGQLRLAAGLAVGVSLSVAGCAPLSSQSMTASVSQSVSVSEASVVARDGDLRIQGVVRDADTDEPIENAIVVIQSTALPTQQERMTNAKGLFVFPELPSGNYTVQALSGQANVSRVVELVDHDVRVNFNLEEDNCCLVGIIVQEADAVPMSADSSMGFVFDVDGYREGDRRHPVEPPRRK